MCNYITKLENGLFVVIKPTNKFSVYEITTAKEFYSHNKKKSVTFNLKEPINESLGDVDNSNEINETNEASETNGSIELTKINIHNETFLCNDPIVTKIVVQHDKNKVDDFDNLFEDY